MTNLPDEERPDDMKIHHNGVRRPSDGRSGDHFVRRACGEPVRLVVNPSGDVHGHALDYAADIDRAWFNQHPGVDSYTRLAVDHEWCVTGPDGKCQSLIDRAPPCATLVVEVTLVGPGVRLRRPLFLLLDEAAS